MNSLETIQSPNHYEVLGADPSATLDQLEGLFRQLAEDADTKGDHSNVARAIEAFKVLRDPELRQQYDQQLGDQQLGSNTVEQVAVEEIAAEQNSTVETQTEEDFVDEAPTSQLSPEEELKLSPNVLAEHRRELLKMFYEKKRKDIRNSGIAIGGLDSIVPYSYELLEFHLWVLAEKKWVLREESGALSISASGCEAHEQNLMDGIVKPGQ